MLRDQGGSKTVPVLALSPSGSDRLGELEVDPAAKLYMDPEDYTEIEAEVKRAADGQISKTGVLLYGAPGNGKTQFVKYLAKKHSLPIYVSYMSPDYSNYDIARMFSEVPRRCIVLLEDFDSLFDKRECAMKNDQVRFTFDALLNALDGVHNDYKGVVFVMTANDIERIDAALKERPSRFRFVKEMGPPSTKVRQRLLNDPKTVRETEGWSLDRVVALARSGRPPAPGPETQASSPRRRRPR